MLTLKALQWPGEVTPFLEWMRKQHIHNVLEIGTGPGGMLQMLGHSSTGLLISVDEPRVPWSVDDATGLTHAECLQRNSILENQFPHRFRGVLGNSHDPETINRVNTILNGRTVDLIFLDGDDTFGGKDRDFIDYWKFLTPGRFLATHDIVSHTCGVPRWWKNMGPKVQEFIEPGHFWGGIGVLQNEVFP